MRASLAWELVTQQSQFLKSLLTLWSMLQLEWQLVRATVGKPCCTSTVSQVLCVSCNSAAASIMYLASHLLVLR